MHAALHHRAIIEQAKGVLAERGGLDMAAAFTRLRNHSHRTGQPLTDLARAIITREINTDFSQTSTSKLASKDPIPGKEPTGSRTRIPRPEVDHTPCVLPRQPAKFTTRPPYHHASSRIYEPGSGIYCGGG